MANNAPAVSPVKLIFDPAAEGGSPSLLVEPNPNATDTSGLILLTTYALESGEIETILTTKEVSPREITRSILPDRMKQDILGIRVELIKGESRTPIAEWRALYFPKGKLVDYRGAKELKRPADFKKFWDEARKQLASIPMEPEITPMPEWFDYAHHKQESKTGKCYRVKLNSYGNIPIVCYYFVPKEVDPLSPIPSSKKYPVIQIMPGWGAEELPNDRTAEGLITLSLNPRTHGPSKEYFKTPTDQHHLWNLDKPEEYYYRQAYMDCLRGLDFLVSRPEVDIDRIGVRGGSQGGAFAFAVAALTPHKIAEVVSNVPYLSNFPDFMRLATNGSGIVFAKHCADPQHGKTVQRTLAYIDVANLATWIKSPTLVCVALQDRVCPPVNGIVALNRLPKKIPRRLVLVPGADHEITDLMRQENAAWEKNYLKY